MPTSGICTLSGWQDSICFHIWLYKKKAGESKLTEAKNLVDDLKRKAGEQSVLLAEKQQEADAALKEITEAMQVRISSCYSDCLF